MLRRLIAIVMLLVAQFARAGGAPEQAVIVVNGASETSRLVANEYRVARQIPARHVIEVTGLSNLEQIGVEEFRERILKPVLGEIESRGLTPQIDYVLYSADIPTAIDVTGDIGERKLPRVITPLASINGLTFLHQFVLEKDLTYLDLNVNFYARRAGPKSRDTIWDEADTRRYADVLQKLQAIESARKDTKPDDSKDSAQPATPELKDVASALQDLRTRHPLSGDLLYNLTCVLAAQGERETALKTLSEAVDAGWANYRHALRDNDLKPLRSNEEFQKLIERMKTIPVETQPSIGFRSNVGWTATGAVSPKIGKPAADAGPRYLLSTVLAVTQGRGLTPKESIEGLQRSVQADRTRPKGTIYFEQNGDIRSTTREWAFRSAAAKLESLGLKAVIESGVLPQQRDDVAGGVIGIADFDWPKSGSKILPGAIVEHLTSFGGVMKSGAGQTPLTEFLRHGAAGSSGTVTEPFAIQAKFPSPFIHVHYAEGCSLAEAFYQSVTGPYQLLIVGDALCQPWAKDLQVKLDGLPESNVVSGKLQLTALATSKDNIEPATFELFIDGRRHQVCRAGDPIELDLTGIAAGPHQLSCVAIGKDAVLTTSRWARTVNVRD